MVQRGKFLLQLSGRNEVGFGKDNHRFDMTVRHHGQVPVQPRQVEVVMARLDDERGIDVGGDHLEIDGRPCPLAAQEGLSREQAVDDGRCSVVVILNRHPVTGTGHLEG